MLGLFTLTLGKTKVTLLELREKVLCSKHVVVSLNVKKEKRA
jgi:hypothetical protein